MPSSSSPSQSPSAALRAAPREGVAALAAWHAAWAGAAALLALGWRLLEPETPAGALVAILGMAAPGLAGLILLWRDRPDERLAVLFAWCLAAVGAAGLTGGLGGPLAAFVFTPFVAGFALGGRRLAQGGALGAGLAMLVGLMSVWLGGSETPLPGLTVAAGLMTAAAAAVSARLSLAPSERRLAAVTGSVERIETVLARQPGLTLLIDPSGKALAAYGAAPPALPVDALFAQGLTAAVHAPDRPLVAAAVERALNGAEVETRFAPRLALDRRIVLLLRPFEPAADGSPRLIDQAFDGSLQYAREAGLDAARAEAEAQNAGKSRFLANMSHELRTPLNAVLGFADIMRSRLFGPLPDRYAQYAESIHQAGGHLLDLINDVLDVSKIEAERYQLQIERFDVRDAVSDAMALVRLGADEKGLSLAAVLPPEALQVQADRRAVKQIALNLLSNAIKVTPPGGSVTVTAEAVGPYLELIVADTGVGVAPEDVKRLGRPFEQAGDAGQRSQGTGLGLSLVRAFAELHGGRMSIDSTLGEGTAVTVRLPIVPVGGAEVLPLAAVR